MPPKDNKQTGIKSIARKDFIAIGVIEKTHGTQGDLRARINIRKPITEWAFLEIQGKPVPFYVQSFQFTVEDEALIRLRDIDSIDKAAFYVGFELLMPKGKQRKRDLHREDEFIGYSLIDDQLGLIGIVEAFEEYPNQLLIRSRYQNQEVLIPAVEAFIKEINEAEQTIYLQLPEGLLSV
jgi:16S rRNA processing protein RimM